MKEKRKEIVRTPMKNLRFQLKITEQESETKLNKKLMIENKTNFTSN